MRDRQRCPANVQNPAVTPRSHPLNSDRSQAFGSGSKETIFQIEGEYPIAGLSLDHAGNFYGPTEAGGGGDCCDDNYPVFQGCGTVFQGMGNTIYQFPTYHPGSLPGGPTAAVTFDAAGNIYGTSGADGSSDAGNVFMLSAGQFTYTSLALYFMVTAR
jgi:hypothetical protein